MRPRVRVIALGGTIAMTAQGEGGVTPTLDADHLVGAVPELADVAVVETETFRQLPGAHLRLEDLAELAARIDDVVGDGCVGVVVTQGTDTIEETAFALDLLTSTEAPVVVTGAMRNPSQPGADGAANLLGAVRIATTAAARGAGTLVVLDDTIHAARFVRKVHTSRPSAFASVGAGPIGWVSESRVRIPLRPARRVLVPRPSMGTALPRVGLVTAAVGDGVLQLAPDGFGGLVVEAMGAGHVPLEAADQLEALARRIPVVLVSRAGGGEVYQHTYGFPGSERDLLARGVLPGGFLDGLKARVLLCFALAAGWDRAQVAAALEELGGTSAA